MINDFKDSTLRHRAAEQGYTLHKSRSIKSKSNWGGYMICKDGYIEAGKHFDMFPENVDWFLREIDLDFENWINQ